MSLKRSGRSNPWVSRAILSLADVAQKRGDERAMLGYLEETLKLPLARMEDDQLDMLGTQQDAVHCLAQHYRDKRDFKQALAYYTRWDPQSRCGTCLAFMYMERSREIALCQLHLGDQQTVVRERLLRLRKGEWVGGFDAWVLCRLYSDAGQLDDLRRLVDDHDRTWKQQPQEDYDRIGDLRGLLRVEELAQKKDVAALVALCQDRSKGRGYRPSQDALSDPVHSAAADALGALNGVEAVQAALAKKPNLTVWLVYALGRNDSPAALETLTKLADKPGWDWDYCQMDAVAYALALHGEPGKKVLRRLAEQPRRDMAVAADAWLNREALPAWPKPSWPRPKAGSLPKELPLD
jgi:hypothetical protein